MQTTTLTTTTVIGLSGSIVTVRIDGGKVLGHYFQGHGETTVDADNLPSGCGELEAVAAFASKAGVQGWTLSEGGTVSCNSELTGEVARRTDALGGREVYVSDLAAWAYEMGLCPSQLIPALLEHEGRLTAA